jgi:HTH-type transcriptional regulator / antitoxin HipB
MDYPIPLADQLKSHLRSLRQARGLTQAQLGRLLGLGQVRIAEIEANPAAISVDQLFKLLTILNVGVVLRDGRVEATLPPGPPTAVKAAGKVTKNSLPQSSTAKIRKAIKAVQANAIEGTAASRESPDSSGKVLRKSPSTGKYLVIDKNTKGRW